MLKLPAASLAQTWGSLALMAAAAAFGCSNSKEPSKPAPLSGTHRLLASGFMPVGPGGHDTCSHEEGAQTDRWCAFYKTEPAGTELWVLNMTQALAGYEVACDGTSPLCRRLTSKLWTDRVGSSEYHPWVHRFDGDTLIFYTETTAVLDTFYEGEIYGWRPGWGEAKQLTGSHGVSCMGHHRSAAVVCRTEPTVEVSLQFGVERRTAKDYRFSLGVLQSGNDALVDIGVLPLASGSLASIQQQAVFSKNGRWLFLAQPGVKAADGSFTSDLLGLELAQLGAAQPKLIAEHVRLWLPAYDDQGLYFLDGVSTTAEGGSELSRLEFDTGVRTVVATNVTDYARLSAHDEFWPEGDEGVFYLERLPGEKTVSLKLLPDVFNPASSVLVGRDLEKIQVAIDQAHTFHLTRESGGSAVAHVRRNDGSGGDCVLSNPHVDAFSGHFSDAGKRVFWLQLSDTGFHEGWVALPSCSERKKFAPAVLSYLPIGDELVAFTAEEEKATPLRIARTSSVGDVPLEVQEIHESADTPNRILTVNGARYLVFQGFSKSPENAGIFVHGPLQATLR